MPHKTIPTSELKRESIPSATDWHSLTKFALTFDPAESVGYGKLAGDVSNATDASSIAELRYHLYVEQRRWNHLGEPPDQTSMQQIRKIVELLGAKIHTSAKCA